MNEDSLKLKLSPLALYEYLQECIEQHIKHSDNLTDVENQQLINKCMAEAYYNVKMACFGDID